MTELERRRRVEDVCDTALQHEETDRAAFVAVACGDDEALRKEVEELLAHAQRAEGFLATPIGALAAEVLTDERPWLVGHHVGVYQILSLVGEGGMGQVYRARDTKLNRNVALKILPESFVSDRDRLGRFKREAQVLASLNHPNISAIYGLEESNGLQALVLELVEGPTLADRIGQGPIPLDKALPIARQICEALEAAHEQGVVHRDLKPANIKVRPDGTTKVLDFGLAKALNSNPEAPVITAPLKTESGMLLGTAAYMSPEQACGEAVDKRTDIWAFGCVLFEMLTGEYVFRRESVSGTLAAVSNAEPDWGKLPAATPVGIRRLLYRCLEKDAKRRLRDIGEARIEIESSSAAEPRRAELTSVTTRAQRAVTLQGRLGWLAAFLALVGLITFVVFLTFRSAPGFSLVEITRFSFVPPEMPNPGQISISPDGQRIAFVALKSDGISALFVRPLNSDDAQPLPGTEGAANPFWSPDSQEIAFSVLGKLKRIDATRGHPQDVCDIAGRTMSGTWNSEGVILFGGEYRHGLRRVPASGGEPVPVTALDESQGELAHLWPFFLPDGRHFLYQAQAAGERSTIYVGSLDSSEKVLLSKTASVPVYYMPPGYLLFHRDSILMAQPFDTKRLALSGDPIRIAEVMLALPLARASFAVSNTGTLVYRAGDSRAFLLSQLTWYTRAGKSLGTVGLPPDQYRGVALSPDNKQVAVHRHQEPGGGNIWIWDQERTTFQRFTTTASHDMHPVWSSDGRSIAFDSARDGGSSNLYQKSSSADGNDELLLKSEHDKFLDDWVPNGRSVLYTEERERAANIWSVPLNDLRTPRPIVTSDFDQISAKVSPDGRWLAYASLESGRPEVFVRTYAGGTGHRQISNQGGSYPRWARNGKELFYLTNDGAVMAVDILVDGSGFKSQTPHLLFKSNAMFGQHNQIMLASHDMPYDVSADGQRFLINEHLDPAKRTPITVVLNWSQELAARVARK